jgi:hypothetical protein
LRDLDRPAASPVRPSEELQALAAKLDAAARLPPPFGGVGEAPR